MKVGDLVGTTPWRDGKDHRIRGFSVGIVLRNFRSEKFLVHWSNGMTVWEYKHTLEVISESR